MEIIEKTLIFLILAVTMITLSSSATAPGGASIDVNKTYGPFSSSPPNNVTVSPGEVLEADLYSEQSTQSWTALFGEASGNLVLGESSNTLYEWAAVGKYVYAAPNDLTFGDTWQSADSSVLGNRFEFLDEGTDSATDTFDSSVEIDSYTQSSNVSNTAAATTYNANGQEVWETAFMSDGSNYFFAGVVQQDGANNFFDGSSYTDGGYQILLPRSDGSDETEEYKLYVELE